MATKYRVGVIGRTGRGNYGHGLATVWSDIPNTEVVALADEDPKGRDEMAQKVGARTTYADYREMLDKERLQIVAIAPRWLDCHRDMVLACADRGCHIYLEKPLCRTLEEADEMIDACNSADVKTSIAHQTRYSPVMEQVQLMIREGVLGDIVELRGRGKEDRRGGGEDLMVLGTHIMDLMRMCGGEPWSCFGQVLEKGKPVTKAEVRDGNEGIGPLAGDEIHAMYRFDSPAMGYFSTHKAEYGKGQRFGLHVHGTRGKLTIRTGSLAEVYYLADASWNPGKSNVGGVKGTSAGPDKPEPISGRGSGAHIGNVLAVKDLIECIETGRRPKGNLEDGRSALQMILAIYASHREGGPVSLPLRERRHPLSLL